MMLVNTHPHHLVGGLSRVVTTALQSHLNRMCGKLELCHKLLHSVDPPLAGVMSLPIKPTYHKC
jgi:hypothetical protein